LKKSQEQVGFARELRGRQTDAEKALGAKLKNSGEDNEAKGKRLRVIKVLEQRGSDESGRCSRKNKGSFKMSFHPHLASPFKGEGFYTELCGRLYRQEVLPFPWPAGYYS
jgi:hypothetical protein